jgi:hypothetical protein
MEAAFDCGRNTRQQSASVKRHEINSLHPRREFPESDDAVFKIFQERDSTGINYIVLFLWHKEQLYLFLNPTVDREANPGMILIHASF